MIKKIIQVVLLILLLSPSLFPMKIDRVILSSDAHPFYLDFWPIVAKAWRNIGIKPTLALIENNNIKLDESLGDVIKIKPIPNIPIGFHAQIIRLFLPIYFEDEVCITADIDMLPISKEFLVDSVKEVPDNKFVVYNDQTYCFKDLVFPHKISNNYSLIFPISYCAAKGNTFKEIFEIENINQIPSLITYWYDLSMQIGNQMSKYFSDENEAEDAKNKIIWRSDERMLIAYLKTWKFYDSKCVKLGYKFDKQFIDRFDWKYDIELLKEGFYRDAHLPRPYAIADNKRLVDQLLTDLGWKYLIPS